MKTSETKTDIIKSILVYVPSRYVSQFLGVFTSLIMKRFLGPLYAGIWDLLKVIMQYVDYTELGATSAVYYKIPFLNGQGKQEEAKKAQNAIFCFITGASLIAGACLVLYAFIFSRTLAPEMFWGLCACSVIVMLDRIYAFYVLLARSYKDYAALSRSILFDAVLTLLTALFIVSKFRLYGLFVGVIITTVLNLVYIRFNVNYHLRFKFNFRMLIAYIKFGFPLYINSIITMLLNSVDRIMIVSFLGFQQLGFYSIAMMSKSYSNSLITNFSHVTSPYFVEDAGRHGDAERTVAYVMKGTFSFSCAMAIIFGFIFIYATPVITSVLPSFLPGLTALRIFLLTGFFSSLMSFPTNYIVLKERQNALIAFATVTLAINVLLNYAAIHCGYGINGVSVATAIASFVYFLMVFVYAMKQSGVLTGLWRNLVRMLLPAVYIGYIVVYLERHITYRHLWGAAVVKSVFLSIFSIVLIWWLEQETGLVRTCMRMLKERFRKNG